MSASAVCVCVHVYICLIHIYIWYIYIYIYMYVFIYIYIYRYMYIYIYLHIYIYIYIYILIRSGWGTSHRPSYLTWAGGHLWPPACGPFFCGLPVHWCGSFATASRHCALLEWPTSITFLQRSSEQRHRDRAWHHFRSVWHCPERFCHNPPLLWLLHAHFAPVHLCDLLCIQG